MTVLTCVVNVLVTHAPSLPECLLSQQQQGQPLDTLQAICSEFALHASCSIVCRDTAASQSCKANF